MVVVKKKDKKRDRGVAFGANLGLIATVIMAVRGWFTEKKHQRELARKRRERKARRIRFAVKAARIASYFVPIVIALVKSAGLISKIRGNKKKEEPEQEEDDIGIEVIQAEPVASEAEVYEKVNSESPEKD